MQTIVRFPYDGAAAIAIEDELISIVIVTVLLAASASGAPYDLKREV